MFAHLMTDWSVNLVAQRQDVKLIVGAKHKAVEAKEWSAAAFRFYGKPLPEPGGCYMQAAVEPLECEQALASACRELLPLQEEGRRIDARQLHAIGVEQQRCPTSV